MISGRAGTLVLLSLAACDPVASPIGAPVGTRICRAPLLDTVAQYDLDDASSGVVRDSVGGHDGVIEGAVTAVDGPPGCGRAVAFGEESVASIQIAHAPAWDLAEGSVDFWFRPDGCPTVEQGVLTRDAEFTEAAGHFRVFWIAGCRLSARSQRSGPPGDDHAVEVATADPLEPGRWTHFAVNFGPPGLELFVNGARAGFAPSDLGIAGNMNPWSIGASNDRSVEGTGKPLWKPLRNAAIDHVRISRRRQDWTR